MNSRNTARWLVIPAALALGVVASMMMSNRPVSPPIVQPKLPPPPLAVKPVVQELPPVETPAPATNSKPAVSTAASTPEPVRVPDVRPPPDPRLTDPVFKEQLGRYALSFVGADATADAVWATLIYDDSLSDTVREDLMEDLNENGFSGGNGRVATADDLALIESRILLLEAHMPGADDFMLEHLWEAHKDLVNMWTRLNR